VKHPLRRILATLVLLLISAMAFAADNPQTGSIWASVGKVLLLLLPVIGIFAGAYFYIRHLHNIFYQFCSQRFQLETFAKSPLGLPEGTIGAMLRLVAGVLLIYFVVILVVDINVSGLPSLKQLLVTNGQINVAALKNFIGGISSIVFLLLVIVGAIFYMQTLQKRFFNGCVQNNQLQKFFEAPAGLPEGTVRSVLALMIVAISLYFIVFQFYFSDKPNQIPEGLMTLLTAVVTFYFAHRASVQSAGGALAKQTEGLLGQRDAAVKAQQQTKADSIISKVHKALQVTQAASAFLPEKQRKQYEALAGKLQSGLSTAESLLKGDNPGDAANLVSGALGEFGRGNPMFQAVAKALPEFTRVLGVSVPALGLITSLVSIGVRIGTARYERWKLRILQAPIAAATLEVQQIDGLMAERLFRGNPVLARAFATELGAGDSAKLAEIAENFLKLDTAKLWAMYRTDGAKQRFDSQEEFENTLQVFRRLFQDDELRPYVEPTWLGQIKDYDTLVGAVDKLHEDEAAHARLDELVVVSNGLMAGGQPMLQIMEKIEEEIKRNGTVTP